MKASLTLTGIILIAGGFFITHDHQKLTALKNERQALVLEARGLGLAVSDEAGGTSAIGKTRASNRLRAERPDLARQTAAELIAFAKEMEEQQKSGGGMPDGGIQKRILAIIDQVMELTPAELRVVIDQLRAETSIKDELRDGLLGFTITTMAEHNPKAALALLTEAGTDLSKQGMAGDVVSNALASWAKDDPLGALEWVRKNRDDYPDIVTENAKRGIIRGAAQQDPALAFQLLSEMDFENPESVTPEILESSRTPEAKLAAVDLLRKYLADEKDPEKREAMLASSFSRLANARTETYESTTKWLADANLDEAEAAAFARGLNYHRTQNDTGKWIGWMAGTLPPEKLGQSVEGMVSEWTRQDFQAAGTWLTQAPDDAAKAPAIKAYAETVAEYEPETAAQWAMTLPPGETRTKTLINIYHRWPGEDTTAKEAFARKHGINP